MQRPGPQHTEPSGSPEPVFSVRHSLGLLTTQVSEWPLQRTVALPSDDVDIDLFCNESYH